MPIHEDDLILHHFYRHVRMRPDATYLTQPLGNGRIDDFSFARALDEAKRMAAYLKSLGLPPQSHIAMISKNCAHFVLADLAIWMAGHVSVPLYATLNADGVRYILEHSDARFLFIGKIDSWDHIAQGVPSGMPCVALPLAPANGHPQWNDILKRFDPIPGEPRRKPEEWSTIIYTSGSTGKPKGVVHTFASISAPTKQLVEWLGLNSHDRILSYLPLAHAMERWISECCSLRAGFHVYFAETLETFVADLKRARPTLFLSVPRLWLKFQLGVFAKMPERKLERMLKIPVLSGVLKKKILAGLGLSEVRFAGSGSAPAPPELLTWYRELGLELLEGYGLTEDFNYSHLSHPGKGRAGYVGPPHPDVECKLSAENEVLIKSPGMMVGYYKDPELTAESFTSDGFLKTGDRGVIAPDGQLMLTGRIKELFKTSKGKYVAPVPIENLLNRDNHVELSCVAGVGHPQPHAVVQLAEHVQAKIGDPAFRAEIHRALEQLLETVNAQLMVYERLEFIAVAKDRWTIEDGHLTPSMKLKRNVIEEKYAPLLEAWYALGEKVIWEH